MTDESGSLFDFQSFREQLCTGLHQGTGRFKTYLAEMDRPFFKQGNLCGQEKGEKPHFVDRPAGAVPAACSICVRDA